MVWIFFKESAGFAEYERAAQNVTVSGEVLGDRVHGNIGAQLQRALIHGRGHGAIAGHQNLARL